MPKHGEHLPGQESREHHDATVDPESQETTVADQCSLQKQANRDGQGCTAAEDHGPKKRTYEKTFHTSDYFIYDPDSQKLQGWHLNNKLLPLAAGRDSSRRRPAADGRSTSGTSRATSCSSPGSVRTAAGRSCPAATAASCAVDAARSTDPSFRFYVTIASSLPASIAFRTSSAMRRPVDIVRRHSAFPYGGPTDMCTFVPPPIRGATS